MRQDHSKPWIDLSLQLVGLKYTQLDGIRMAGWAFSKSSLSSVTQIHRMCNSYLGLPLHHPVDLLGVKGTNAMKLMLSAVSQAINYLNPFGRVIPLPAKSMDVC